MTFGFLLLRRQQQPLVADMGGEAQEALDLGLGEAGFDEAALGAVLAALDLELDIGGAELVGAVDDRHAARRLGEDPDPVGGERLGDRLGAAAGRDLPPAAREELAPLSSPSATQTGLSLSSQTA